MVAADRRGPKAGGDWTDKRLGPNGQKKDPLKEVHSRMDNVATSSGDCAIPALPRKNDAGTSFLARRPCFQFAPYQPDHIARFI